MSAPDIVSLSDWMIDTFVYTGLLIGLVLLVRRPVAQYFGPQIAYALWALPLLRFVMPPIVLPAWMNPGEPTAPLAQASGTEPLMVILSETSANAAETAIHAAAPVADPLIGIAVTDLLLPLWLSGAAIFLILRTRDYIRMRRDLLADARPMGESGKVRLVETSAVSAPVAFGIRDKVVALPADFMALLDVRARDMAIAHELEHHRGHDLLANIAAQPLLALHWFNPLAWWGWRAMRRDQEAACDARVVAGRARSERAAYAEVIAGFAAGEHLALAAPMASGIANPVLGEKSIIHRLRSLTLSDISVRRRRIGIAALTTTALALPLTASISYAAPEPDQDAQASAIETIDPGEDQLVWVEQDSESGEEADGDRRRHVEVHVIREGAEGEDGERRVIRRIVRHSDHSDHGDHGDHPAMSEAEIEAMMAEIETELEGLDGEVERSVRLAMRHSERAGELGNRVVVINEGAEGSHNIDVRCGDGQTVARQDLGNGRQAMVICHSAIQAHAATGIRAALAAIASNRDIPESTRAEIMRELEAAIAEMEEARHEMEGARLEFEAAHEGQRRISWRAAPPSPPKPPRAVRAPSAVTFSWSDDGEAQVQDVRMVSPITGVLMVPDSQEECDEAERERTARIVTRISA